MVEESGSDSIGSLYLTKVPCSRQNSEVSICTEKATVRTAHIIPQPWIGRNGGVGRSIEYSGPPALLVIRDSG